MIRAEYRVLVNGLPGATRRSFRDAEGVASAYRENPPSGVALGEPWDIRIQKRLVASAATHWVNTHA